MPLDDEEEREVLNTEKEDDTEETTVKSKTSRNEDLKIPRLFFQLYFGIGAIVYTIQTLWVFFACWLSTSTFATSGIVYMFWITGLMWISTGLTFGIFKFGIELRDKGCRNKRARFKFIIVIILKLMTDSFVFHGTIAALQDPRLNHYHEFSQFVGPLIYYGLLYLVTIIEVAVFMLTICLVEDPFGFFPFMEMLIEYKKQFMLKYCTSEET